MSNYLIFISIFIFIFLLSNLSNLNGFSVGGQSCKCDDCKDTDGNIRTYYDNCSELSPSDCQYGYSKDVGGGKFKCVVGKIPDTRRYHREEMIKVCEMSGGNPNITGTCPDCKDPYTNGTKMTRGQCKGLSQTDCSRMWGLDKSKNPKPCTWSTRPSCNTDSIFHTDKSSCCNPSGGNSMTCPLPPAPPVPPIHISKNLSINNKCNK